MTYENEKDFNKKKKQLLCHLLCGPRADLWPVYGLGCAKEIDLSLKRQAVNAVIFINGGDELCDNIADRDKENSNDDDDVDDDDFRGGG